MARDPFVSGLYREEEDVRNWPRPSIEKTFSDAKKYRSMRKCFGDPNQMPTPEEVEQTKRRFKDD